MSVYGHSTFPVPFLLRSSSMNSFLLFCKEYRKPYALYFKGKNNSEITSLLGKAWKSLPQEKKQEYEEAAKSDKTHRNTTTRSSEMVTMQSTFRINKPIQKKTLIHTGIKGPKAPRIIREDLCIYVISDTEIDGLLPVKL